MELNSKDLKRPAWEAMRAAVPSAILVALVYYLLSAVLPQVVSLVTPSYTVEDLLSGWAPEMWTSIFLSVLLTLYNLVLRFGFRSWCLRTARRRWTGPGALLDGFGMAGRVLLMELWIFLRILGWALLLSIGIGILSGLLTTAFDWEGVILFSFFMSSILVAAVYVIMLRYALSPYLLWDYPDDGASAAVRRSTEMMRGNKWRLFKLYLSFWPWFLGQLLLGAAVDAAAVARVLGQIDLYALGTDPAAIISQLQAASAAPLAIAGGMAVNLVFALSFTPYLEISVANFYRGLSGEPVVPAFSGESF